MFSEEQIIAILKQQESGVATADADIQISMDGKGAWRDNVFIERL
jgi:hypothetical protein